MAPRLNDDLRNVVIVDALPVAAKDKAQKLTDVLKSRLIAAIKDRNPTIVDVYMPMENDKTLGYFPCYGFE